MSGFSFVFFCPRDLRNHGLFAPRSKWRKSVLPQYKSSPSTARKLKLDKKLSKNDKVSGNHYRTSWAYLLKRVFDVDGFACPHCGEQMKLRSVSVLPPLTLKLLKAFRCIGPPVWNGFYER